MFCVHVKKRNFLLFSQLAPVLCSQKRTAVPVCWDFLAALSVYSSFIGFCGVLCLVDGNFFCAVVYSVVLCIFQPAVAACAIIASRFRATLCAWPCDSLELFSGQQKVEAGQVDDRNLWPVSSGTAEGAGAGWLPDGVLPAGSGRNFWNSPISENSGWKIASFWFLMYGMRTSGPGLAGSNSPCAWEMSMARMNLLRIRLTSISSSSSPRCCMRSASSLL